MTPGPAAARPAGRAAAGVTCPRCGAAAGPWLVARDRSGGPPRAVRRCLGPGCGVGFTWPPPAGLPAAPAGGPQSGVLGRAALAMAGAALAPLTALVPRGGWVVDLGGGSGLRAAALMRAGFRVSVVEPDPGEAARARGRLGAGVRVAGDLSELPDGADAVLAWHVIEHVGDLDGSLRHVAHALRPGGLLVAAVPNPVSAEAGLLGGRWHGWEPARHRWHLTRGALGRVTAAAGLEVRSLGARGGWGYPAALAFSLAPGLDPQVHPGRGVAGPALCAGLVPVALAARAAGRGAQLVVVARRPG